MAQIVSFDPANLRIVELAVSGDTAITWQEIYSEWKDWILADPIARGGYEPAFSVIGGEERGGGAPRLGTTFFLLHGWRFRPAEYSHNVTISGNIVTVPAGERCWVPTLGAFTVGVQLESSNLVDTVAVGSGVLPADVTEIAAAARDAILSDSTPFSGASVGAAAALVDVAVSSRAAPGEGLSEAQAGALTRAALLLERLAGSAVHNLVTSGEFGAGQTATILERIGGVLWRTHTVVNGGTASESVTIETEPEP